MKFCCCILSGTGACKGCANNHDVGMYTYPEWEYTPVRITTTPVMPEWFVRGIATTSEIERG